MFPEKRRELAMIALGDKAVQDLRYYSSLHQKAEEFIKCQSITDGVVETPVDFSSNSWKIIKEGALGDTLHDSQHLVQPSDSDNHSSASKLDAQHCATILLCFRILNLFSMTLRNMENLTQITS